VKNILIIGATAKLAKLFIEQQFDPQVHYWLTARNISKITKMPSMVSDDAYTVLSLKLNVSSSVNAFCKAINGTEFNVVLVFSSTYEADSDSPNELYSQHVFDMTVNANAIHTILKSIQYCPFSSVIVFGDAWLGQPKKDFGSYTLSKTLLSALVKSLTVDLAPSTKIIEILLGPTLTHKKDTNNYYRRCLIKPARPAQGLLELIHFLYTHQNLNMTGMSIIYDGGARLNRNH